MIVSLTMKRVAITSADSRRVDSYVQCRHITTTTTTTTFYSFSAPKTNKKLTVEGPKSLNPDCRRRPRNLSQNRSRR